MSSNRIYKPTWLYIKQHNQTGLKYFGKTVKDPYKYNGSGIYWTDHLRVHGTDVSTIWCQLFESEDELTQYALTFSEENNIVNSSEWANLIPENGLTGFPTGLTPSESHRSALSKALTGHKDYRTEETKRVAAEKASKKLRGMVRSSETKKRLSEARKGSVHTDATKKKMKEAWTEERRHNQSLRTKEINAKNNVEQVQCPHCGFIGTNKVNMNRFHFDKCSVIVPRIRKHRTPVESRAVEWVFTDSTGHEVLVTNLRQFCRENSLNNGSMSEVAAGNRKQHKGWRIVKRVAGGGTFP